MVAVVVVVVVAVVVVAVVSKMPLVGICVQHPPWVGVIVVRYSVRYRNAAKLCHGDNKI